MALKQGPMTFEIEESQQANVLLQLTFHVSTEAPPPGLQIPPGGAAVEMTMALKQELPLRTQLSLIHDAIDSLKRLERALLSGSTDVDTTNQGIAKA